VVDDNQLGFHKNIVAFSTRRLQHIKDVMCPYLGSEDLGLICGETAEAKMRHRFPAA
jgi:hypothetical protein